MRVRAEAPAVIDLPDDFRDVLVALHEAGAEFLVGVPRSELTS